MRVRVIQVAAFPKVDFSETGIRLIHFGDLSHYLEPGEGLLIYRPGPNFDFVSCFSACEVIATYPADGLATVDIRTTSATVEPDRHARHIWRDRPVLCPDVKKVRKYRLLEIFADAFADSSWNLRKLEDATNYVFRPNLSLPTLYPRTGSVYLFRTAELHKIGKSIHAETRKKQVERTVGEELELIHQFPSNDYTRAEVTLHLRYGPLRKWGEWFALSDQEVNEILTITEMNF